MAREKHANHTDRPVRARRSPTPRRGDGNPGTQEPRARREPVTRQSTRHGVTRPALGLWGPRTAWGAEMYHCGLLPPVREGLTVPQARDAQLSPKTGMASKRPGRNPKPSPFVKCSVSYTARVTHITSATRRRAPAPRRRGARRPLWGPRAPSVSAEGVVLAERLHGEDSTCAEPQEHQDTWAAGAELAAGRATPGTSLAGPRRELSAARHQQSIPGPRPERVHARAAGGQR